MSQLDQELPDMSQLDQELPDMSQLDQELPDMSQLDQELPDMSQLDQELPDMSRADMTPSDMSAPQQEGEPLPPLTPTRYNTLIGRPTATSVAISVLPLSAGDRFWVSYSERLSDDLSELVEPLTSEEISSLEGEPVVIELTQLTPHTRLYYRVHRRAEGSSEEEIDTLQTLHTQRALGESFRFTVQGDTHPERWNNKMFHPELFRLTLAEVRELRPDLHFTLGDDFSIEKIISQFKEANFPEGHFFSAEVEGRMSYEEYLLLPQPFEREMIVDGVNSPQHNAAYRELRALYFGEIGPSTALMLTNGNHEQAHLAHLGGVFHNAALWAAEARLKYYPLPAPNETYSAPERLIGPVNGYEGLSTPDQRARASYAFHWGDALFVTLDPYWHSHSSPNSPLVDDPVETWDGTLGDQQYHWLKEMLEGSEARWKFVFAHHINGGGRGGAVMVDRQEWGGGSGFQEHRPSWGKSIHELFVDTGVTVFFQGHDHIFAREIVDGVVYQSVPNPADNSYFPYNCDSYAPERLEWAGADGYGAYDPALSVRLPNTGVVDVEVSPERVTVSYRRTYRAADLEANLNGVFYGTEQNGEVAFRYSLPPDPLDHNPADVSFECPGRSPSRDWQYAP
jgi:hypothetical protein